MKSREEHLSWAKQRALINVDMGEFAHAVTGLRETSPSTRSQRAWCPRPKHYADSRRRSTQRLVAARRRLWIG